MVQLAISPSKPNTRIPANQILDDRLSVISLAKRTFQRFRQGSGGEWDLDDVGHQEGIERSAEHSN